MKLTFTEAARNFLEAKDSLAQVSLYYDAGTQVCACAYSGVFILRANDDPIEYDGSLESNLGPIKVQEYALIYLDQENVIDFKANSFILKSERGYLNLSMRFQNKLADTVQS